MKKILSILLFSCLVMPNVVFAAEVQSENEVIAPKWEDYVPEKYQNPKTIYTKSEATKEIILGGVLTDTLLLAPVGIPILCKGVTKMKNVTYSKKKEMFEAGLKEAALISDNNQKQAYYNKLLADCKMTEKQKQKLAKKRAKSR